MNEKDIYIKLNPDNEIPDTLTNESPNNHKWLVEVNGQVVSKCVFADRYAGIAMIDNSKTRLPEDRNYLIYYGEVKFIVREGVS